MAAANAFESAKLSYNAMRERYDAGMASSMDLSRVLLDQNLAEFTMIRARYDVLYTQEVLRILTDTPKK